MKKIQSKSHKIGTYEVNKISLSCFDDKRFVLDDGIHTLAYFHKDLEKQILTNDHKEKVILTDKSKCTHMKTILTDENRFRQIKISAHN